MPASHSTHRQRGDGGRPLGNSSNAVSRASSSANAQDANQASAAAPGTAPGWLRSP